MELPQPLRVMLATAFVASLAVALVAGLLWAYNPEAGGGLAFLPDTVPLAEEPTPTPVVDAPAPTATPDPDPTPTATPTEDPEELIAAAADPSETTVQVLEAGGGRAATQAAAAALSEELGYRVVNVTSARVNVEETTVWFTSGNEAEARALRARDARFAAVAANRALNEGTNLHVLVGPDWPTG